MGHCRDIRVQCRDYAAHNIHTLLTRSRRKQRGKKNILHITIPQFSIYVTRIIYQPSLPTAGIRIIYNFAPVCIFTSFRCNFHHHRWKWIYFDIRGLVFLALFGFYGCFELSRSKFITHPPFPPIQPLISIAWVCVFTPATQRAVFVNSKRSCGMGHKKSFYFIYLGNKVLFCPEHNNFRKLCMTM